MGLLLRRIDRLVKAEINYAKREIEAKEAMSLGLAGAGGAAGASIGRIGIVAKGTGFSVGIVPLTASGALTGFALYEVIRAIAEEDASSLRVVAMGAATGAAVSATVGTVGIAAGGTAFAVGMAPMAVAGAVAGLGIASLKRLLQQVADPEHLLDLAYEEMQEELVKFRQSVAQVIAAQKRSEKQYNDAQNEVNKWHRYAQLALQKGDENLARQALERKRTFNKSSEALKVSLEQQTAQINSIKPYLIQLESKIAEARAIKPVLRARIAAAKAQANLQNVVRGMNTSSAMAAFERMEEKVLMQEARALSAAELAGVDLEAQFKKLEASSDVDDELAALKAQITLPSASLTQQVLPQQSTTPNAKIGNNEVVDTELESLRRQLDRL